MSDIYEIIPEITSNQKLTGINSTPKLRLSNSSVLDASILPL